MKGSYATGIATLFWIAPWVAFPQSNHKFAYRLTLSVFYAHLWAPL